MLLAHLGEGLASHRVWGAVARVLSEGRWLTPDLSGRAETADLAGAIVGALA